MIVTRFPPSPTGYLHIGSVRTALYSWLYAKKHHGKFILRIEDTDRQRSTDEATQVILDGMKWLSLDADEGPYFQTQRFPRYKEVIQQLLQQGKAYRCCCSKERLDTLRATQQQKKIKPRYDGHCRDRQDVDPKAAHVIRFKNPLDGQVTIHDQVLGKVVIQNQELDDLILARTDGTPTYNLTVVVDDWDMGITHVIRGNDHLNNTPRQINLLEALGAEIPVYAHIPMILGEDGKRLSKRHGAVSVLQFREEGILPEALLNYLVRLGWSSGDQEIFSSAQMVTLFDISGINKSPSAFDPNKLMWFNQQYLKTSPSEHITEELQWHYQQLGVALEAGPDMTDVVQALRERVKTVREMAEKSRCFFSDTFDYDENAVKKHLKPETLERLIWIRKELAELTDWNEETIHDVVTNCLEKFEIKLPKLAQPLRIAMTGNTISPSIDVTLSLMGQENTLIRLDRMIAYLH